MKKKSKLIKLRRQVLRGMTQCADIMFDLNQKCVAAGQSKEALWLRSITCYHCELLGSSEQRMKEED